MSRRPRQPRENQWTAGRIEPRFAAPQASQERPPAAAPTPAPPAQAQPVPQEPVAPRQSPYALPENVIPSWVAQAPAPATAPDPEPLPIPKPPATTEPPAAMEQRAPPPAEARARDSYWSKIHVPEEERDRAAKAGLYRYVKEAAAPEAPRKAHAAPPRAIGGASDGKPRIWLTVIALLMLFGAGAYGLSQLADTPPAKQSAQSPPAETGEPTPPASIPPEPTLTPAPSPAPAPRFIEVAP